VRKFLTKTLLNPRESEQTARDWPDIPVSVFNLGSGSRGNCSLICNGDKSLMVDCGFSRRQTMLRMNLLGLDPRAVCGILVSHEHGDHMKGAQKCSGDLGVPILGTNGTLTGWGLPSMNTRTLVYSDQVEHDGFSVTPVQISHDTKEPCAFLIEVAGVRSLFATDIGTTKSLDLGLLGQLDFLYIEANHDDGMLRNSPYPISVKNRIAGDGGHLSNQQCGRLIKTLASRSPNLRTIMLAHLSAKSNHPAKALKTAQKNAGMLPGVKWQVAEQDRPTELMK
jgi:phosphoribosyl 1,2-cyclic phosphodiesterase